MRAPILALAIASAAAAIALAAVPIGFAAAPAVHAQESAPPAYEAARVVLEGEVLDAATGLPVAAAIVALPSAGRSDVTDEMGYFRIEEVPAGVHSFMVMRLGYQTLEASAPVNGEEVLALYITPGPIPLDGIEVRVLSREDIAARASGLSSRGVIGPVEMEDLRERYIYLDQILTSRPMPRSRFRPPAMVGDKGCLMATGVSLRPGDRRCAAVVVDGVLLSEESAGWVYAMDTNNIFAMRFLYGPEASLRYGLQGGHGVLIIETRAGR